MKFKSFFKLSLIVLLASSCREYEKNIKAARENQKIHGAKVFDGEMEPLFPDSSENNETILGVDKNKNGVRDDVDVWINYVGRNFNDRMALRQLARAYDGLMMSTENKKGTVVESKKLAEDYWDAINCAEYFGFDGSFRDNPHYLMRSVVANNSLREDTLIAFYDRTITFKSSIKDLYSINAYLACKFEIENLKEEIKRIENMKEQIR